MASDRHQPRSTSGAAGGARQSATLGLLRKMLGWTYRPSHRPVLDNLSDHMLRDIGIEPDGREDESNSFWRRR